MPEFCIHEEHGGICVKSGGYCNLGACPLEELKELTPVVRCKDCVNGDTDRGFFLCCSSGMVTNEDNFCGYGERKENK